jgi:uncharacterized protein (TIGR03437 family)
MVTWILPVSRLGLRDVFRWIALVSILGILAAAPCLAQEYTMGISEPVTPGLGLSRQVYFREYLSSDEYCSFVAEIWPDGSFFVTVVTFENTDLGGCVADAFIQNIFGGFGFPPGSGPSARVPRRSFAQGVAESGAAMGPGSQGLTVAALPGGSQLTARILGSTLTTSVSAPNSTALNTAGQYTVGPEASQVTAADFNGDGNADLAVSNTGMNPGEGNVQIFLGKGDGTFSPGATVNAGPNPVAMYAADFNSDGKLDLAVVNQGAGISVLLGNGDGTFQSPGAYPVAQNPMSVVAADFNGDGRLDIAVAAESINVFSVSVLLGKGDGTFQPAVNYPAGFAGASYLAWMDLNGDGKLDLIVCDNRGSGIAFLFGNGDGSFQAPAEYVTGALPGYFALVSGSSSAQVGVVTVDGLSGDLVITPILPTGVAASPQLHALPMSPAMYPSGIAATDLNGDGFPDMVVADGFLSVLLRNPGVDFTAPVEYNLQSGSLAASVAVADLNGDGHTDVVSAGAPLGGSNSGTVDVVLGKGDGTLGQQHSYAIGGYAGGEFGPPSGVVIGDFNGDGKPDVAAGFQGASGGPTAGGVSVLLGNGDGTLRPAVNYATGSFSVLSTVAGDFNGDGKLEIAAAGAAQAGYSTPGALAILVGKGDGTFQNAALTQVGSPAGTPVALAAGDINRDGKLDLVATVWDVNLTPSIVVLLGNGDGTFRQSTLAPLPPFLSGTALVLTDLNGDGNPDLVIGGGEAVYLAGNGDGTFQSGMYFSSGTTAAAFAAADWNQDGVAGLAIAVNAGTGQPGAAMGMESGISSKASGAPHISSVENGEGGAPTIAPNTWIEVDGSGLAPAGDTRTWQNSDFVNQLLPAQLDGVSVTVNGKPAYVYFISAGQVNVLTPPDALPSGPVQVVVTNDGVASAAFTAQAQSISPSWFIYSGTPYVAARHADQSLIGPASLYPGSSTPAKPGETVELYANGFGPTSQAVVGGSESQGGTLSPLPGVTIGGVAAQVTYAGLAFPGEFQFNVVIPSTLPNGDQTIIATYGGASTQSGVSITIHN